MHPSIITNDELYIELKALQEQLGEEQLPLQVTKNDIPLWEKTITLECFISKTRITHILHIPIVHAESFDYYHLYSIPIRKRSQFKVIITRNKFLALNQLRYTYTEESCQKVAIDTYLCPKSDLQVIRKDAPCEVKLLHHEKDTSTCQQIEAQIPEPVLNQLDYTDRWIMVLPQKETVQMYCPKIQEEERAVV